MSIRVIIPCSSLGNLFLKKQLFQVLITYKTNSLTRQIRLQDKFAYKTNSLTRQIRQFF